MFKETWIYLLKDNTTGFYKIGNSIKPFQRLQELRREATKMPITYDLQFIEAWRGLQSDETDLHRKFKSKRLRGEWFDLDDNDLHQLRKHLYFHTKLSTRCSQAEDDREVVNA